MAVPINERRNAAVDAPNHRHASFDSAERRRDQVLIQLTGATKPGIVGQIHKHIAFESICIPLCSHSAHQMWYRVFKADQRCDSNAGVFKQHRSVARVNTEVGSKRSEVGEPREDIFQRNVLAKNDSMNLVVAARITEIRASKGRRVVDSQAVLLRHHRFQPHYDRGPAGLRVICQTRLNFSTTKWFRKHCRLISVVSHNVSRNLRQDIFIRHSFRRTLLGP